MLGCLRGGGVAHTQPLTTLGVGVSKGSGLVCVGCLKHVLSLCMGRGRREEGSRRHAGSRWCLLGTWWLDPRGRCPDWTRSEGLEGAKNNTLPLQGEEKGRRADIGVHVKVSEGRREDAWRVNWRVLCRVCAKEASEKEAKKKTSFERLLQSCFHLLFRDKRASKRIVVCRHVCVVRICGCCPSGALEQRTGG